MPASSCARSSAIHARQAERGREQARRLRREIEPAGVGAAHDGREPQQRLASRGRTPRSSRRRCRARRDGSRTRPRCRTASAPKRSATATTSAGATNRNTAAGSTKRRISQGQAMRSILGRARVTQTVRPCASRGGSFAGRHERQARPAPGLEAAFEHFGRRRRRAAARRRRPALSFWPLWQTTTAERPENSPPSRRRPRGGAGRAPGIRRGSAAKSSSVRTSIEGGTFRRADEASELFGGDRVD